MNREQYRAYLQSAHWRVLRLRIIERAGERCEWCRRFCGRNPHPWRVGWCGYFDECDWCVTYFDADGDRSGMEMQTLQVHHLTYERLGREEDADLVAICESCHDEVTERAQMLQALHRGGLVTRSLSTVRAAGTRFWQAVREAIRARTNR